ncbi:MAG: hypothetical protein HQ472_00170 [Ignavibacteria bacterium]|nr:hypothetical protein [Ignavibacteria bacterium]
MNIRLLLTAFLMIGASTMNAQQFSHGDPTVEEQLMLEMINRARANPTEEGIRLMDTDDADVQSAYNYFQIDRPATKLAFTKYPVRPPLSFHVDLIQAARGHTADMIAKNFQGHTSSNGKQLENRYADVGYSSLGQYGENVSAYSNSVWYGHCGLNVDWGGDNQVVLGHRSNIMNFSGGVYTEIGLGITNSGGGLQSGTVGPWVITQDFGIRTVRYVLGVVYNDKNNNGFYDIGEGMPGVEIRNSKSAAFAITSTSGGYSVPMTSGSVTITASGGGLSAPITKTVNFSTDNVKVDFIPASLSPGVLTLKLPANNTTKIDRSSITFSWNASSFADEYEIEVSTSQTFATAQRVFLKKIYGIEYTAPVTDCNTKYFWRVRGVNTVGNGTWSVPFAFTTSGTKPIAPNMVSPKGAVSADFDKTVKFTYTPVAGATAYHVRLADQPNMVNIIAQDSTLTTTEFSVAVSDITNKTFYWMVRSANECGWSGFSSSSEAILTVTDVEVDEPTDTALKATILPNPMASEGSVKITSPEKQTIVLSAYSMSGTKMFSFDYELPAGVSTISLPDVTKLPSGAYSLVISSKYDLVRQMFVVSH